MSLRASYADEGEGLLERGQVAARRSLENEKPMIQLTRLNGKPLIVNADLIKFIENLPDTVLTLITGDKLVVRESSDDILARIAEFHQRSRRRIPVEAVPGAPVAPPDEPGSDDAPKSD